MSEPLLGFFVDRLVSGLCSWTVSFINQNPSKVVRAPLNVRHERPEYLCVVQLLIRRDSDGTRRYNLKDVFVSRVGAFQRGGKNYDSAYSLACSFLNL